MSIVISMLCRDSAGQEEVFVAHDGRVTRDGRPVREDYIKSRAVRPNVFAAYAGRDARFGEQAISGARHLAAARGESGPEAIARTLRESILNYSKMSSFQRDELQAGNMRGHHYFVMGGQDGEGARILQLFAMNDYEPEALLLEPGPGVVFSVQCDTPERAEIAKGILLERIGRPVPTGDIPAILRETIERMADMTPTVNKRHYVRRLSRGFELEE